MVGIINTLFLSVNRVLFVLLFVALLGCAQNQYTWDDLTQEGELVYLNNNMTLFSGTVVNHKNEEWVYEGGSLKYYRIYFENGQLCRHVIPIDARNSLTYEEEWTEKGELWRKVHYKGDEKHGAYKDYYPSGSLHWEGNYEEGEKVGIWKLYYESGQLEGEINFKYNMSDYLSNYTKSLINPYKAYYKNGQIKSEGGYLPDSKRHGNWNEYDEDGQLKTVIEFYSDEITRTGTNENGKIKYRFH